MTKVNRHEEGEQQPQRKSQNEKTWLSNLNDFNLRALHLSDVSSLCINGSECEIGVCHFGLQLQILVWIYTLTTDWWVWLLCCGECNSTRNCEYVRATGSRHFAKRNSKQPTHLSCLRDLSIKCWGVRILFCSIRWSMVVRMKFIRAQYEVDGRTQLCGETNFSYLSLALSMNGVGWVRYFDQLECALVRVNWFMICLRVISIVSVVLSNKTERELWYRVCQREEDAHLSSWITEIPFHLNSFAFCGCRRWNESLISRGKKLFLHRIEW